MLSVVINKSYLLFLLESDLEISWFASYKAVISTLKPGLFAFQVVATSSSHSLPHPALYKIMFNVSGSLSFVELFPQLLRIVPQASKALTIVAVFNDFLLII